MDNNQNKEASKKKALKILGKIGLVAAALAISIAFSDVSFVDMGHDFFMRFLKFTFNQQEEETIYTPEPAEPPSPSPSPASVPEEDAGTGASETGSPQTDAAETEAPSTEPAAAFHTEDPDV